MSLSVFIYLWLYWVFVAAHGVLSRCGTWAPWDAQSLADPQHVRSSSNQELNPHPLHGESGFLTLDHGEVPYWISLNCSMKCIYLALP